MSNDLLDVFSTSTPAQGDGGSAQADPLSEIFASGDQPLAQNTNQAMPAGDKYSVLGQFYTKNMPPPGMQFVGGPTQA